MMHELHSENYAPDTTTMYIYVFIRTDIYIANQLVQVGHVCYDAGKKFQAEPDTHLILLSVKNEDELLDVHHYLVNNKIDSAIFYEPDNNMGYTAICSEPVMGPVLRSYFYRYDLWTPKKGISFKQVVKRIFSR